LSRYSVKPEEAVFVDDNPANAAAASRLGIHGIAYRSADQLRAELARLRLL